MEATHIENFYKEGICPFCDCDQSAQRIKKAVNFCPCEEPCKRGKQFQEIYCSECHIKNHKSHDQYSIHQTMKSLEKQWGELDTKANDALTEATKRFIKRKQFINYCDRVFSSIRKQKGVDYTTIKEDYFMLKALCSAIGEMNDKIQSILGQQDYNAQSFISVLEQDPKFNQQNAGKKPQYPLKELLRQNQELQPLYWKLLEDLEYLNDLSSVHLQTCYKAVFRQNINDEIEDFSEENYRIFQRYKQQAMLEQMQMQNKADDDEVKNWKFQTGKEVLLSSKQIQDILKKYHEGQDKDEISEEDDEEEKEEEDDDEEEQETPGGMNEEKSYKLDGFNLLFVKHRFWLNLKEKEKIDHKYYNQEQILEIYVAQFSSVQAKVDKWKTEQIKKIENEDEDQEENSHERELEEQYQKEYIVSKIKELEEKNQDILIKQDEQDAEITELKEKVHDFEEMKENLNKLELLLKNMKK